MPSRHAATGFHKQSKILRGANLQSNPGNADTQPEKAFLGRGVDRQETPRRLDADDVDGPRSQPGVAPAQLCCLWHGWPKATRSSHVRLQLPVGVHIHRIPDRGGSTRICPVYGLKFPNCDRSGISIGLNCMVPSGRG